jgi:hypothetical protein
MNAVISGLVVTILEAKVCLRMKRRYGQYWKHFVNDYHAEIIAYIVNNDSWARAWYSGSRFAYWAKVMTIGWIGFSWILNCYYDFVDYED